MRAGWRAARARQKRLYQVALSETWYKPADDEPIVTTSPAGQIADAVRQATLDGSPVVRKSGSDAEYSCETDMRTLR